MYSIGPSMSIIMASWGSCEANDSGGADGLERA